MGNLKLLVVDDEPMMRQLLAEILREQGFEVILAENGSEALPLVSQNEIALVLTDINMPRGNGLKLVADLRAAGRNIPIVLMTGDAEQISESEAQGASILRKPFRRGELVALIRSILSLGEE